MSRLLLCALVVAVPACGQPAPPGDIHTAPQTSATNGANQVDDHKKTSKEDDRPVENATPNRSPTQPAAEVDPPPAKVAPD